ncbi:hypothetical protein [Dokdonia sp. Asnod3-C12]|uniref:DUF7738 domain-containing protein n=1 Tax=Dokdonia sp. Asnod3-C12 TaxID=3160575 RepID=UPI00386E7ECB
MKYLKILTLVLFSFQLGHSQDNLVITFSENNNLKLNDLEITSNTSFEVIANEIGQESTFVEKVDGGIYIYDNGLSFNVISGIIISMSINFNWDGDENVSAKTFQGKFLINNVEITKDITENEVLLVEGLELICPFPGMCMSKDKTPGVVKAMVAFEDSRITQFGFILNR